MEKEFNNILEELILNVTRVKNMAEKGLFPENDCHIAGKILNDLAVGLLLTREPLSHNEIEIRTKPFPVGKIKFDDWEKYGKDNEGIAEAI